MALYPKLLAKALDDKNPKFKSLISSLTGLYLVHHKQWALMRPFIAAGGLAALLTLIDKHPMLQVVSQALNVLLLCTDEELYAWHDPPLLPEGSGPKEGKGPDASAWAAMHDLSKTPFIKTLLKHATPSAFPEASHLVLKIIAFYLSWLRRHYTPNGILSISAELIDSFKNWGTRAINKDESMPCLPPSDEELQLASKLYDDFSRFPPAEESSYEAGPSSPINPKEKDRSIEEKMETDSNEQKSPLEIFILESSKMKQQADQAFREKELDKAIDLYSQCLDMMVPSEALALESKRRSVLHANRAASYLSRATALTNDERPGCDLCDSRGLLESLDLSCQDDLGSIVRKHYEAALMDSQSAVDIDPSYFKAWMRKAMSLLGLGRGKEAMEAAQQGRSACGSAASKEIDELIDKIEIQLHPISTEAVNELEEMD